MGNYKPQKTAHNGKTLKYQNRATGKTQQTQEITRKMICSSLGVKRSPVRIWPSRPFTLNFAVDSVVAYGRQRDEAVAPTADFRFTCPVTPRSVFHCSCEEAQRGGRPAFSLRCWRAEYFIIKPRYERPQTNISKPRASFQSLVGTSC